MMREMLVIFTLLGLVTLSRLEWRTGLTPSAFPSWPYAADSGARQSQGLHGLPGWRGIDITAGCGALLVAPIDGIVTYHGWDGYVGPYAGPGEENTMLMIENGTFAVVLLHGRYTPRVGQNLRRGEPIGSEDEIGNATGCHTHFIIWEK